LIKSIHIIVTGVVQGVGFRYYTKQKADNIGVKGTVMNLRDGSVEIFAEAEKKKLDQFLIWCHSGPTSSTVQSLNYEFVLKKLGSDPFSILR